MPKVVLVTGGSSGIGKAIATELNSKGYRVYATSRSCNTGDTESGIHFINMDVTDTTSVKECITYLTGREKHIDVLINNAGVGFAGPLEETTTEEISAVFATNVFGVLEITRNVLPLMRKQRSGHIINISSIGGRVALPYRGVYSASKFALEGLSESLSQEVRQFGIHVTVIEPGGFSTNITQNRKTTVLGEQSVYKDQFLEVYKRINDELAAADTPDGLAKKVAEIIESRSPALRYVISRFQQRLPIILKPLLPSRYFEKLIMNHFKIPTR